MKDIMNKVVSKSPRQMSYHRLLLPNDDEA